MPATLLMATLAPTWAHAVPGSIDRVPAATLLLPWFELAPTDSLSWTVAVSSVAATPKLAHVTVWSDLGAPVLGFDLYLPAFGGARLDLADLLVSGHLPARAPANPVAFGCVASDFGGDLTGTALRDVQARLRGEPDSDGTLVATPDARDRMRGYITIDVTSRCTDLQPQDLGYFITGGLGVASNDNVLIGDFHAFDAVGGAAFADPLVHLEAFAGNAETSIPGQYTFYGSILEWSAADNREPLATRWYTPAETGSELIVWHDPRRLPLAPTNAAGIADAALDGLGYAGVYGPTGETYGVTTEVRYPAVTQRVPVIGKVADLETAALEMTFGAKSSTSGPPEGPAREQAYVIVLSPAHRCGAVRSAASALALDTAAQTHQYTADAEPPAGGQP